VRNTRKHSAGKMMSLRESLTRETVPRPGINGGRGQSLYQSRRCREWDDEKNVAGKGGQKKRKER